MVLDLIQVFLKGNLMELGIYKFCSLICKVVDGISILLQVKRKFI